MGNWTQSPGRLSLFGLLLAQGAPAGLMVHHQIFGPGGGTVPLHIFIYVWAGTSIFFLAFGWMTGIFVERARVQNQRLGGAYRMLSQFDHRKRQHLIEVAKQSGRPVSTSIEFLDGWLLGDFGPITTEQRALGTGILNDLLHLDQIFKKVQAINDLQLETICLLDIARASALQTKQGVKVSTAGRLQHPVRVNVEMLVSCIRHLIEVAARFAATSTPVGLYVFVLNLRDPAPLPLDPKHPEAQAMLSAGEDQSVLAVEFVPSDPVVPAEFYASFDSLTEFEATSIQECVYLNGGRFWIDFGKNNTVKLLIAFPIAENIATPKKTRGEAA